MKGGIPVDWYDWSDEAFRKARDGDKPVLLFVTAEWCHAGRLMEETVFGDAEIAGLLRQDYVPVRVDSDRRPDINDRYNMGGWPTTAFLTPGADLLGGATYVGLDPMRHLLGQIKTAYATKKARIAEEIARRSGTRAQQAAENALPGVAALSLEIFRKTVRGILATFDLANAGFGKAPKYPMASSLRAILHAYHETGGADFEQVLLRTLDAMAEGGMYDAEEGGFFHYATNDTWTAARFEKIGEDNAELIRLYLDAAAVTGQEKYAARALHALAWVRAKLFDPERGVFRGSQAGDEDYYLVPASERARGAAPPVDPTVYVTTCAPMASAFLRAAQALGVAEFEEVALRCLEFLLRECVRPEGVAHYHDGEPRVFGLARDRIALGTALLDAYDHTGEERYLRAAAEAGQALLSRFWSAEERGILDRLPDPSDRGELARPRRAIDENGRAAEVLARLWRRGAGEGFGEGARRVLLAWPDFLDGYGHFTADYAMAADWVIRAPVEIVVGDPALRPAALRPYVPRRVVRTDASGKVTVARGTARLEASTPEEVRRALEGP
jgi:hypothetical protein